MRRDIKQFIASVIGLVNFIFAVPWVLAQTTTTIELPNYIRATSTIAILNAVLGALQVYIAPPLVGIMVVVGAFQILFASGDPEKFSRGKMTILYAVIGYAIVLVAGGITSIIASIIQ
ncbi:hypothetical protein HY967_04625 [Candidatus Jorgensenbacteria bacterium]|nr:hypothetical protein [Candidatus Jorgensenbacteria bacterium]